jgi:O-antigen ligase
MWKVFSSNKLDKNQKMISMLFALMPLLLITGSFLSDLGLSIISIYFFFIIKKLEIKNNNLIKFFFIFYFLFLINSLSFDYYLSSIKSFFFYFRFLLFILVMIYLIKLEKYILNDFFKIMIFSLIIILVSGFYEYYEIRNEYFHRLSKATEDFITIKNTTSQRVSGIFNNEKIMGGFLLKIFSLYITIFLFLNKNISSTKNFILILLSTSLIGMGIFISGDRAPIILFCFQLFLFFCFIKKNRAKLFLIGIIIFSILCLLTFKDRILKERLIYVTVNDIYKEDNDKKKYNFLSKAYEGHFKAAILIFKDNPILGSGIKGFRHQCIKLKENLKYKDSIVCTTHPHNIFLHILAETGILGILIYLSIFFYLILKLLKIYFKKKENWDDIILKVSIINLIVALWPFTTSGSFFNNYNSIFFSLLFLFFIIFNKKVVSTQLK